VSLPVAAETIDADTLCRRFEDAALPPRDLRALHKRLTALAEAAPDERAAKLDDVARWVRVGRARSDEPAPIARLRTLLDVLGAAPVFREALSAALASALDGKDAVALFESGLPNDRGLWKETADRLARRLLPTLRDERDLGTLVDRFFPTARDADWLAQIPPELAARAAALLPASAATPLARAALDALALVAARTTALGLSPEIRARSPEVALAASPFFLLPRLCDALSMGIGSAASCREQAAACRDAVDAVLRHLEEFGVSVDVVYRIEVIGENLDRIGDLLALVSGERSPSAVTAVLARLVRARATTSVRDLVRKNLHLMARKVIERAGETGEHYITATRREWFGMLASAAGGGFLTCGTAALKFLATAGALPLFVEGALASANYATSFLLIQLFGFTLASKQPSMTAAALAHALHGSRDEPNLDELVTLIARICRSQLIAAIGNVCTVVPTAIAFHYLYLRWRGHPFLDEQAAAHALDSLHPWRSGTIWFAAFTGFCLWLSSLGAGWLENWATYRRLFDAIAQKKPKRLTGWFARYMRSHISGFGGSVSLGILLGMMPVVGKFLGVPLEVRHITLSTGALAIAACTFGRAAPSHGLWPAIGGIGCILALNFAVSFLLALGVAMRARGVEHAGFRLLRAIAARLVRSPGEFFFPPRGDRSTVRS